MPRKFYRSFVLSLALIHLGCGVRPLLSESALYEPHYKPPDYSNLENWAALPFRQDSADALPDPVNFFDRQANAEVDVFFIHPTSYTMDKGQRYWNARLDDEELNHKTDRTSILHQASIFNGIGKIYAPRYRQAHLHAYFAKNEEQKAKEAAFELAYKDIVAAFSYYLENYNQGRPMIIACHSQGATHGMRLLKEFFDGKALQKQLVVAYLVGMPVAKDYFTYIPVCDVPEKISCFCSWRTFREGYHPKRSPGSSDIAVVNPLSWTTEEKLVSKEMNKGGVLRKFHNGILPKLTDAQIYNGIVWARKPHFPGSFLLITNNYHVGDYNLYWVNIRDNVEQRAAQFLDRKARPGAPSD